LPRDTAFLLNKRKSQEQHGIFLEKKKSHRKRDGVAFLPNKKAMNTAAIC
jgi:hypothetical protein